MATLTLNRDFGQPWVFSLYSYKNEVMHACVRHIKNYPDQEMITVLLFGKKFMIIGWLSGIIKRYQVNNIYLIPVPIHRDRFLDRGYNQSEMIAKALRDIIMNTLKNVSVTIDTECIIKSKVTEKQALIDDRAVRLENMKNAFTLHQPEKMGQIFLKNNAILIIVDDITTTGGTLSEIRNVCTPHEERVFGFTLGH
jgi:predicted amidophosphoribosyltransferase